MIIFSIAIIMWNWSMIYQWWLIWLLMKVHFTLMESYITKCHMGHYSLVIRTLI